MQDKIDWMLLEASADGMELGEDDLYFILAARHDAEGYTDAEIEYVLELDQEWEQK